MPIRNPFARRANVHEVSQDENVSPSDVSHPGFERVDTVGSKASSALSIKSARSQDTGEYKLSGTLILRHWPIWVLSASRQHRAHGEKLGERERDSLCILTIPLCK
jgi:hypothetical protein